MAIGGFCFARVARDNVWHVLHSPSRRCVGVFREFFAAMRLACEMPRRAVIVSVVVALKTAPQRALQTQALSASEYVGKFCIYRSQTPQKDKI